jgi:ELWxxDGT repeat protein
MHVMSRAVSLAIPFALAGAVTVALPASAAQGSTRAAPAASLVDDIAPGPLSSDPRDLTAMNGELFFSAFDPRHGRELWKSDGTAAGTRLVSDIVPGRAGSSPQDISAAFGQEGIPTPPRVLVYFSAQDPRHGRQLWKSDGTAAGTVMITDVNPGSVGLAPAGIAALSDATAMFSGNDGRHGREPWITDGTTAGTHMFEDLNPGPAGSNPADITASVFHLGILFSDELWYFSASDGTHGREFFVAYKGGTPSHVYDINPGRASSNPGPFDSVADETGLIAASSAAHGREPFVLERPPALPGVGGPGQGTATELPGVRPGEGSNPVLASTSLISFVANLPVELTRTYFSGDDGIHGRQLWQVDEFVVTSAGMAGQLSFGIDGVRLVADIGASPGGSDPQGFTTVGGTPDLTAASGGTEVFSARDRAHGRELWTSNGWPGNTALAADINPGPASSDPRDITVIGQVAYFSADDGSHGRELWKLIVPPTPRIALTTPAFPIVSVTAGKPVTVRADLPPAPPALGQPKTSGRVSFFEDGAKIATAQLAPDGSGGVFASATLTARLGTHPIVAFYQGDGTFTAATSNTVPLAGS